MKYLKNKWFPAILTILLIACQRDEKEFIRPVPLALEASEISSSGFTAYWKSMLGANDYTLEVSHLTSFDSLLRDFPKTTTDTAYNISNLEANRTYYYRVKASKYNGPTDYSKSIKVITEGLVIPAVLDPAEVTSTGFRAQWKKVEYVSSYQLYVATDVNFTKLLSGFNGKEVKDTVYTLTNLEINQPYFYKVRSRKGTTVSDLSQTMLAATSELSAPILAKSTAISYTNFIINWQPITGATSYLIFVSNDPLMTTTLTEYTAKEVNGLALEVKNLNANTNYYYRVQAKNNVTLSGKSDIAYATTTALSIPENLAAQDIQISSFVAHWKPTIHADSYAVDVSRARNFFNYVDGYYARKLTDTTLQIIGLEKNTTYYYRVKAQGLGSTSGYSGIMSVVTGSLESPVVSAAQNVQMNSFEANWAAIAVADSYLLDVAYDAKFENILPGYYQKEFMGTEHVVIGLEPSTTYFYRVRIKKGEVFSDYSNAESVVTLPLPAPVIDTLKSNNREAFEFEAHWETVNEATSYLLYIAENKTFTNIVSGYNGKEILGNSWQVTGLDPYKTYYYRVRGKKQQKLSNYSTIATVAQVINGNCRLASREYVGLRREAYLYNNGLLSVIELRDLTQGGVLSLETSVFYDANNHIDSIAVRYNDLGTMRLQASYKFTRTNGVVQTADVADQSGAFIERWRFVYVNNRISEFNKFTDEAELTLKSAEAYVYNANNQLVEVMNEYSEIIKKLSYNQRFNAEYLLPVEAQMLLYDVSKSTDNPFVSVHDLSYYQYLDSNRWRNFSYVYEYNSNGMPVRLLGNGDFPDLIYEYENCSF